MMTVAEWRWRASGDDSYLWLARQWSKGAGILFAVGAVSGTVLSFELGLLWPRFMQYAGAIIGMPFSLEGFAFFTEAIFLGIYLYGWNRVPEWLHLASGGMVAISGLLSTLFVTAANGWMNTPAGFRIEHGQFVDIHPFAAMFNPAAIPEGIHMALAAYCAGGFATAGIHAWLMLRRGFNHFDSNAIKIALAIGGMAVLLQSVSGDALARMVASRQPMKLASLEGQFQTERSAPLRIGGIPFSRERVTKYAIEIPDGLSLLAFHSPHALIQGLEEEPEADWPDVRIVHICFQVMVGCGMILCAIAILSSILQWKSREALKTKWYLRILMFLSPLGFIALEAGWMVTELGRQPWIIYHLMRTRDAVTSMPNLNLTFSAMTALYILLGVITLWLLAHHVITLPERSDQKFREVTE
ncbi:cytochrome ubiquinol oxidase subunit I [Silvibacterium dinghuense]|nr:cytochrome ubiquinol oxidase subunit I [Silvibacterium dinghuense]